MLITLTEKAAARAHSYLAKQANAQGLRLGVRNTGCSGYMYTVGLADTINPDDQIFESQGVKGQERTAKFAVAFLRVMWQCEQFLLTGEFKCNLEESDLYPLLKRIKPMSREEIQKELPVIVEAMSQMDMRVAKAEGDASLEILNMKPDIDWIEDFLYRAYADELLEYKYMYEDLRD